MPQASSLKSASSGPMLGRANSRATSVLGSTSTAACTSPRLAIRVHLQEGGEAAMERRRAAGHQARLEDLEQLLPRRAEADRAPHVHDETGLVQAPERQERDGDEFPHLRRDVPALSQAALVDPIVALD